MNEELKTYSKGADPCPYCGRSNGKTFEDEEEGYETMWTVICYHCGGEGPATITEAEAIAAWNTRDPAVVEAFRKANGECIWKPMDESEDTGSYNTSCGHVFTVIEGSLMLNGFKYCTYCGMKLVESVEGGVA